VQFFRDYNAGFFQIFLYTTIFKVHKITATRCDWIKPESQENRKRKEAAKFTPATSFHLLITYYSALTNVPFAPHFSHFCGLQRPSLLKPHSHFHVAMNITTSRFI